MTDTAKPLPRTLAPPKKRATFMVERTNNGAWFVRDIYTQRTYAYADIDSMLRDMPTIFGEDA